MTRHTTSPKTSTKENVQLELQPAFECGFHVAEDVCSELPGSFADEFGELHGLKALDVQVALLSQPRHTGQGDFVCVP